MFVDNLLFNGGFPSPLTGVAHDDDARPRKQDHKRRNDKAPQRVKVMLEIDDLALLPPIPFAGRFEVFC